MRDAAGPDTPLMAVVKANAYGHGAPAVVRALAGRVRMFGVADVREAREVRAHAPATPVFILGPALPEERAEVVGSGFIPAISSVAEAQAYGAAGGGKRVPIHLDLDTGMGRIGMWQEEALAAARAIMALPGVEIAGVSSHLPSADEDEDFTRKQLARFRTLVGELRALGIAQPLLHVANSAGALGFPVERGEMVRAGLSLYGVSPLPAFQTRLQAVLTWKARVTLVREVGAGRGVSYGRSFVTPHAMRIATLPVGYADGYQRHLSNCGAEVLVGGQRCPVLGRVTMDQILVDVSAAPGMQAGDEAVLLGRQGNEEIPAMELAQKAGTIPWEIFTGIGARVQRIVSRS